MYTKVFLEVFSSFLAFFTAGLLLSNSVLVYIGLIPLFFCIFGIVLDQPKNIEIVRSEPKIDSFTGDVVEVSIGVTVKDGVGTVVVGDKLPPHFELVDGNNFKVIWKGIREKTDFVKYKVRCTTRGIYTFEDLQWESNHFLNLQQFGFPVQ